jgi:hypothetical protein
VKPFCCSARAVASPPMPEPMMAIGEFRGRGRLCAAAGVVPRPRFVPILVERAIERLCCASRFYFTLRCSLSLLFQQSLIAIAIAISDMRTIRYHSYSSTTVPSPRDRLSGENNEKIVF